MFTQEKGRVAAEPRDTSEFVAELRQLSGQYWDRHPFHARLHDGSLTERELRIWAANRWYYQQCLPQKDAAILANCPVQAVRRVWIDRILYHDGRAEGEGGMAKWLHLAEAVGLTKEEVLDQRHIVPGVRFAVDAYTSFARTRPWTEAVASGLTEMFSPDLMKRRLGAMLEKYPWISRDGLAYFESRIGVTTADGIKALDLVVEYCLTREQQDAAIAALEFKCDVLWSMLDAIDLACQHGVD